MATVIPVIAFLAVIVLGYFGVRYLTDPSDPPIPETHYRLPLNIKPIYYRIDIEMDPRKTTFHGNILIEIQALTNTKQIQLHTMNHDIYVRRYYKKNTTVFTHLPKATPNSLSNIVVYNLKEELQANVTYVLHFTYFGSMSEEMHYFYDRKNTTTKTVSEWLGASPFAPIFARRIFPCFDEPGFKATYGLSLTYPKEFHSTGPTNEILQSKTKDKVYYRITPIMSTYLLTFTISKFYVDSLGQLRIVARPQNRSQLEYSRIYGTNILAAFYDYFGRNVSGITENIIHLIAVPYSEMAESLLLYDNNQSTLKSKQVVANIVAYEIAQLWWGNLVTCAWWSYTWLNEGFKTYFQYFGTDLVEKSFEMPSQFVIDVIQAVMNRDATIDTCPMSNEEINTKADIIIMFNSISLKKGATFIRMTYHILGEERFKKSLNEYLTTHAYKSTIPSDLFTIWRKHCLMKYHHYLERYFNSFTTQVGYPVVTFNRASNTTVEVSQKRFLLKDFDTADRKLTYTTPITYTTSSEKDFKNTQPDFFLENNLIIIPVSKDVSWIIGNIQETGYYRVNYDINTWKEIGQKLLSDNRTEIHELNRAQIVDDLLNLARAGEIEYSVALTILIYLKNEPGYLPLAAAFNGFSYIMTRLGNETEIFAPFIRDMIRIKYHSVYFEEVKLEATLDVYNRVNILDWSCKYGILVCVKTALTYFKYISSVPVNVRPVVYCAVMRNGNESNFNTLYKKYLAETVASEKILILDSLGCVKGSKLVEKYFQIIMTDVAYPADKSIALYNLCTKNNENVALVFDLIDKNIEKVAKAIGGYSCVASIVFDIAEHFTTVAELQKLKDFNENHTVKFGSSISTLQAAVKNVEFNLEWSTEKLEKIKSFMKQYIQRYQT